MESLLGGFQLPFQRRLTKMYTDTKSSYDFVKDPIQVAEDPDLSALHRKLRVQKDRLVSWGLGWSDPAQSADIDESLSKAGLGEVAGSVMSTIKDILAEAEPLWRSSKRLANVRTQSAEKGDSSKTSLITWDRTRFEDLIRDLTASIDTLYDLSLTRESARQQSPSKRAGLAVSTHFNALQEQQARRYESTRIEHPQQIDPTVVLELQDSAVGLRPIDLSPQSPDPPNDLDAWRLVYMHRSTSSTNPWKTEGPPLFTSLLLEFANYDPIYANTGIPPSMERFEKLFAGLQVRQGVTTHPGIGCLNLIGYFEDTVNARYGLLYEISTEAGLTEQAILERSSSLSSDSDSPGEKLRPVPFQELSRILDQIPPPLEVKFRMAHSIAATLLDLHSKGIVHGNLNHHNVVFYDRAEIVHGLPIPDLRRPLVVSFDLFPDSTPSRLKALYNHDPDPHGETTTPLTLESQCLDLCALGTLLLRIGIWRLVKFPRHRGILEAESARYDLLPQVVTLCGSAYARAIKACWNAVDQAVRQPSDVENITKRTAQYVVTLLERCCMIDVDEEFGDLRDNASTEFHQSLEVFPSLRDDPPVLKNTDSAEVATEPADDLASKYSTFPHELHGRQAVKSRDLTEDAQAPPASSEEKLPVESQETDKISTNQPGQQKSKQRLFPTVNIQQHHLDIWHKILMPNINHALRGFYRKNPESVEISMESIGETAASTKPTILVVCTSVGKVRSILKRHFIYDAAIYGLLVCRGRILRSRKKGPVRAMAGGCQEQSQKPQDLEYQQRPNNGASIGACVDGQHFPPVSFGGLVMVDKKPFGMTVHHMLDEPLDDEEGAPQTLSQPARSMTHPEDDSRSFDDSFALSEHEYDLYSDTESEYDSSVDDPEIDDDDGIDAEHREPGDIDGIDQGCAEGYAVTQPALDDVDKDFFPSAEIAEEDHLDCFKLGDIYASSGIRRRIEDGIAHEIDWALFEFSDDRQPFGNHIKGGEKHCAVVSRYPVEITPWTNLHGLEVHCSARTSGLQTGRILPGMTIVKIFGRQTPSQSYQVSGKLGIPGDSGAWIIDNEHGRACGHVLAWSSRKQVAYICPMEILLADIEKTLNAKVTLPDAAVNENPQTVVEPSEEPSKLVVGQAIEISACQ